MRHVLPLWPQLNAKMIVWANKVHAPNGSGNFGRMTGSFDVKVKSGVAIIIQCYHKDHFLTLAL